MRRREALLETRGAGRPKRPGPHIRFPCQRERFRRSRWHVPTGGGGTAAQCYGQL